MLASTFSLTLDRHSLLFVVTLYPTTEKDRLAVCKDGP